MKNKVLELLYGNNLDDVKLGVLIYKQDRRRIKQNDIEKCLLALTNEYYLIMGYMLLDIPFAKEYMEENGWNTHPSHFIDQLKERGIEIYE